jgi:uncharacterized protein YjbK
MAAALSLKQRIQALRIREYLAGVYMTLEIVNNGNNYVF